MPVDICTRSGFPSAGIVSPMSARAPAVRVTEKFRTPVLTGSPWWVDSLNVRDNETYDIAFVADNPGVWMDHCHNLEHATDGMLAHLMYEGVTTPYTIGRDTPNHPE